MNVEALNEVKRVLRNVPEDQFNLSTWWGQSSPDPHTFPPKGGYQDVEKQCGTTACAIGWAANDPWFKERGLTIKAYGSALNEISHLTPVFGESQSFDAVAAFFDIGYDTATWLFDPIEYEVSEGGLYPLDEPINIEQVIRRIDMVLADDPGVGDPCA